MRHRLQLCWLGLKILTTEHLVPQELWRLTQGQLNCWSKCLVHRSSRLWRLRIGVPSVSDCLADTRSLGTNKTSWVAQFSGVSWDRSWSHLGSLFQPPTFAIFPEVYGKSTLQVQMGLTSGSTCQNWTADVHGSHGVRWYPVISWTGGNGGTDQTDGLYGRFDEDPALL